VLKEDLAEVYAKQGYGLTPEQSLIDENWAGAEITGGTDAAGQAEVGAGTEISPEEMTNIDREIERHWTTTREEPTRFATQ
jgi:hypothetical protein